jgi:hypothetical protein
MLKGDKDIADDKNEGNDNGHGIPDKTLIIGKTN